MSPVTPRPCVVPPGNMVGWRLFDEAAGSTVASDLTAGAHDASLLGSPTAGAPDLVGASVRFDGVAQHAVAPHHPDFNFLGPKFSIDFWIKPNAGELFGTIVRKVAPSPSVPALSGPGYHLRYNQGPFFLLGANSEPLGIAGLDAPLSGCPPDAYFFAGRLDELEIFDWKLTAAVG